MSYLNQVIRRQAPLTRCQCAVLAVLTEKFADVDEIWKRGARYASNSHGHIRTVAYGTVNTVLTSLVQQGFAESRRRGPKRFAYRTVRA